jgi:hypothetical protein
MDGTDTGGLKNGDFTARSCGLEGTGVTNPGVLILEPLLKLWKRHCQYIDIHVVTNGSSTSRT